MDIIEFVQSLGFPVAVCVISFWYINKQASEHHAEVNSLTDAINEMRLVMQRFLDHFGGDYNA